jgi:hypothetical protein
MQNCSNPLQNIEKASSSFLHVQKKKEKGFFLSYFGVRRYLDNSNHLLILRSSIIWCTILLKNKAISRLENE